MTDLRSATAIWIALWATTALGAAGAAAGIDALGTPPPHDALDATPATAISVLGHNALIALWPLALIVLGWPSLPGARRVGDALVTAQLLLQGAMVGGALASHPATWRYLPHLPVEWLALAIPAATWMNARLTPRAQRRELAAAAAATLAALTAAAVIETYAVPL
jgi:hypothetical protein